MPVVKNIMSSTFKFCFAMVIGMLLNSTASAEDTAMDYIQIQELSSKYAWGIDTLDKSLLSQVFTKDAKAHYEIVNDSPITLDEHLDGFEAIFNWLNTTLGHRKGNDGVPWHFVTNQLVEIDGNEAVLKFYQHNRPMAAGGIYTFNVIKTSEGWRVKNLHLEEQIWKAKAYKD